MTTKREPALVLLGQQYAEHARHSGYRQLARAVPEARSIVVEQAVPRWSISRILAHALRSRSATRYLSAAGVQMQAAAIRHMMTSRRPTLYHFLYGEAGFAFAARWARRAGHRVIATLHAPPSIMHEVLARPASLNALDGIVLVGSSQRAAVEPYVDDPSKIFVIPHGVDVEFFQPITHAPNGVMTCLSVGSYLRDFALLDHVAAACANDVAIRFVVVAPRSAVGPLADRRNVTVLDRLSDDALRETYQSADVFLLTASDVTANNALLEAMACGLPVITEDVGSIRDYVRQDNATVCPAKQAEPIAQALRHLASDRERRVEMGKASRRLALDLSWSRTADRMRLVYERVADGLPLRLSNFHEPALTH